MDCPQIRLAMDNECPALTDDGSDDDERSWGACEMTHRHKKRALNMNEEAQARNGRQQRVNAM